MTNARYDRDIDARVTSFDDYHSVCESLIVEYMTSGDFTQAVAALGDFDHPSNWMPDKYRPPGTHSIVLELAEKLAHPEHEKLLKRLWRKVIKNRVECVWRSVQALMAATPGKFPIEEIEKSLGLLRNLYKPAAFAAIDEYLSYLSKHPNPANDAEAAELRTLRASIESEVKPIAKPRKKDKRKIDENVFWELISESSKAAAAGPRGQAEELKIILESFPAAQIVNFQKLFDQKMTQSYRADIWDVANVVFSTLSDDAFDYFRAGLIGSGRTSFEAWITNPEKAALSIELPDDVLNEDLMRSAEEAYETVKGDDIHEKVRTKERKLVGELSSSEAEIRSKYPEVCKKFEF